MALWHETADRAWLFVGSSRDSSGLGRLYIFRLDWSADGVTVTPQGSMQPMLAEANNRHGTVSARYGSTAAFSRDGGTLAVSAPRMNEMGAIYVYSRPDGAGEDWGDITYADGVKVTAAAVPSFGTSLTTMPFLPGTAYDASNPRSCGTWCSRVWSNIAGPGDGVNLGNAVVSLSADGRVLVVGAETKDFASTTPGGGFTARRNDAGDVFVWVAPEGGWANAPRADRDAEGNAKTLIAAQTDATNFRQATHYSPGPLRRVTEPAAILAPVAWPARLDDNFGVATAVSPDGAVVAVADTRNDGTIHLFQQNSADGWKTFNGGYLTTPSATFSNVGSVISALISFNFDGTEVMTADTGHDGNSGRLRIITRPSDGSWTSNAAGRWQAAPERLPGTYYGFVAHETSGSRVALSRGLGTPLYLTGPAMSNGDGGGCTISTVDGLTTASCPISLPNPTIIIPEGTSDGSFSINATVAVQLGSGDPLTLRDTLEVTIGEVDELAEVEFDFDTNAATGQPQPAVVEPGGSTTLLLKLLNENGKASAKGAVASVLFTANRGTLSAKLGAAAGEACVTGGGQTCRIAMPATALTASNSDQIRLTVEHPGAGRSGAAIVRVNVLASDGESFAVEPIRLVFSGSASAIALSTPSRGVLSHDTCDAPASDGPDDCKVAGDRDDRDVLTLQVTATDAAGNEVAVPTSGYGATKITGPDGKRVPSSAIAVTWPLREDGDDDGAEVGDNDPLDTSPGGAPQAQLNVNAAQSAQLAAGEYTLELGVGALKASRTFNVSGAPASVALSELPAELSVRDSFTVRATILDAGGAAVPDGTPVEWSATPIGTASTLVETASERRTTGGQAEATYLVVGPGRTSLRADAGAAADLALVDVPGPPAPPIRLAELLASPNPLGSNIWFGEFFIRASSLLRELPDADVVHIWQGNRWYRYSEVEGEVGEESLDFTIPPNAILWFGDDD